MATNGTIRLTAIREMLTHCAPGYEMQPKEHRIWIRFGGKLYPSLPKGKHGRMAGAEIEIGHVKRMVRFFGLRDCARKILPQLKL